MKRIYAAIIPFILLFVLNSCGNNSSEFEGAFSYSPEHPMNGDEIRIYYNPDSTTLAGATSMKMVIYEYSEDLNNTEEYNMQMKNNMWTGKVTLSDSAFGALVKFVSGDEVDHNGNQGYVIYMYDQSGNIRPGANAGLATAYGFWGRALGIDTDKELAYNMYTEAFNNYPNIKDQYINYYISTIYGTFGDNATDKIKKELDEFAISKPLTADDLELLVNWYTRVDENEKAEKYRKELEEKYPSGEYAQYEEYKKFRQIPDIEGKLKAAKDFEQKYSGSKYAKYLHSNIVSSYVQKGEYEKAYDYLKNNYPDAASDSYNNIAYTMYENGTNLELAAKIADEGVSIARNELQKPTTEKPKNYSTSEWQKNRKRSLAYVLDTYGVIMEKLGKNEGVLKAMEEAVELTGNDNLELSTNYASLLVKEKKYEKARNILEELAVAQGTNEKIKELLKDTYIALKSSEEGYEEYIRGIEEKAEENLRDELQEEMINVPAPDFTLKDLKGNDVSLADYKGKTVIVDFWATWCGPCVSSFPGMKQAIEKFSDNDNVKFLFVNTWENVEDKKQNAQDFISKNNYPFHVLLDTQSKVIADYRVDGIPTKFIIDKNGNIRFKSVGFSGNTDQLVKELSMMISMIN